MKGDAKDIVSLASHSTALAFTSVVVWLAAATSSGTVGIWSAIGGAAIALGLAILLFDHRAARALLKPSVRLVLLGAIAGSIMAAATYLLYPVFVHLVPFLATDTEKLYAAFRAPSLEVASIALVPIIVGEELVWRGVVQTTLMRRFGAWGGVALAAVIYALVHVPIGSPVLVAASLFCGLAWGGLRAKTSSLVPTLVAHMLWNLLVLLLLPLDSG